MRFTVLQIISAVVLLLGNICAVVALMSDYWSFYHLQISYTKGMVKSNTNHSGHRGLWRICHPSEMEVLKGYKSCISRFDDFELDPTNIWTQMMGTMDIHYQWWDLLCAIFMSICVAFGVLSMFVSSVCCGTRLAIVHGVFVLLAGLSGLVCSLVYLGCNLSSSMSLETTWQKFDRFGYAFGVANGAWLLQLVSGVLFMVASRQRLDDHGYQRGIQK